MTTLAKWEDEEAVKAFRAIRAAAVVRSDDDFRAELCGVLLSDGFAVASDSYCLIAVPLAYSGPDVVLPASIVDRFQKIKIVGPSRGYRFEISESEQRIYVQLTNGTTTDAFYADMVKEKFANWRGYIVSPEECKINSSEPVFFKIALLARVAKVASELGDRNATIKLQRMISAKDPTAWSIKTTDFDNVLWVQMPAIVK